MCCIFAVVMSRTFMSMLAQTRTSAGGNCAGGLDFIYLCYDTCAHKPGGRRYEEGTMPWHDCHCAVTGPAAWDVLEGALPC